MRTHFVAATLKQLLERKTLSTDSHILAICAGDAERQLFAALAFKNVTITNLDAAIADSETNVYMSSPQDAMRLGYTDAQFDFAFVSDGLHHCDSPHKALLEMYRVARKGVLVFESRDSMLMRMAVALGLTGDFEIQAVIYHGGLQGGVNHTQIPNYVYRWTEREFEKTIHSYNPTGKHGFSYFYGLNLPWDASTKGAKGWLLSCIGALLRLFTIPIKTQRNSFAMIAIKPQKSDIWPWLIYRDGRICLRLPQD